MNDRIFTETERESLCLNEYCEEHGIGTDECEIPVTREEAQKALNDDSAGSALEEATTMTATGIVERSE